MAPFCRMNTVVNHSDSSQASRQPVNSIFTTGRVTSADGTVIGYRRLGSGDSPALILVHGSMMTSQGLMKLATAASELVQCLKDG